MMKILIAGAESVPFASSGGLGDVLGSLPAALNNAGGADVDVRVVLPLYSRTKYDPSFELEYICNFEVSLAWRKQYCGVFKTVFKGVTYYFIDNEFYFNRSSLYGEFDDGERFAFFSKAILDMLPHIDFIPDILHANDWQTALSVVYLKQRNRYPGMKAVYTIHNIEYQGRYGFNILGDIFELEQSDVGVVGYNGDINLTKAAIVCCDKMTTVSPTYACEISEEYFAKGLHYVIRAYRDKICGIINGIDYEYYDPQGDGIASTFTPTRLTGKAKDKLELQKIFGLEQNKDIPMIAIISRLVAHKGMDLIKRIGYELTENNVQLVVLGTGESEYEDYFNGLAYARPGKVGVRIGFDKPLAKQIYAGADIFLMPSMAEPCGLAQMIACRYGTIPVVREIGGLFDTIKPFDTVSGEGNGITFKTYNAHDMYDAINRAIGIWSDKTLCRKLIKNAMNSDFSWNNSANEYLKLYRSL